MGRKQGRYVIVCFTEEMRFIGIFLNASHASTCIGEVKESTAKIAIGQYLNGERIDCYGYIFLKHDIGEEPINTHEIREACKHRAQDKLKYIHVKNKLSNTKVESLSQEDINILYNNLSI